MPISGSRDLMSSSEDGHRRKVRQKKSRSQQQEKRSYSAKTECFSRSMSPRSFIKVTKVKGDRSKSSSRSDSRLRSHSTTVIIFEGR